MAGLLDLSRWVRRRPLQWVA